MHLFGAQAAPAELKKLNKTQLRDLLKAYEEKDADVPKVLLTQKTPVATEEQLIDALSKRIKKEGGGGGFKRYEKATFTTCRAAKN